LCYIFFFFQAEDGIRDSSVTGVQTCALPIYERIVEYEADDFSALNTLGDLYARVEKRLEAVSCYRRVAEHYREQGFTFKAIAMRSEERRVGKECRSREVTVRERTDRARDKIV